MVTICRVTDGQNRNCYSSRPRGSSLVVCSFCQLCSVKLYQNLVVKRTASFWVPRNFWYQFFGIVCSEYIFGSTEFSVPVFGIVSSG